MKKLQILFWKAVGILIDLRPRLHLPKYNDYPIASTDIVESGRYDYPVYFKVLFEWDEKGRHWIVFTR